MRDPVTILSICRLFVRLTPIAAVVFVLAIADIFVSGHLESKSLFRTLPGMSLPVSGELASPAFNTRNLSFTVPSSHILLLFTATQGKLWRGRLDVDSKAGPGEYELQVFAGRNPPDDGLQRYRVRVFANRQELNASYKSVTRRFLGIAPLWIAMAAFFIVAPGLAGSFYLSHRQERQLARQDIVPIAKMARTKSGWEIHFALGRRQGIRPQDALLLLDSDLVPVGRITVDRVETNHSCALVPFNVTIAPTYWLAKAQDMSRIPPLTAPPT